MAKVKSVSSSSFYVNKTSLPELEFGLEIVEDCSPKYDFDIASLLTDINTNLDKQPADNDNSSGKIDNKEYKCSSLSSSKIETPRFSSLGVLAENHLKENKMLPELSFDGDFSLADLLSNDNYSSVKSSKNVIASESDNLFDFLLTDDDSSNTEKISNTKSNVSVDDLSNWMNSSNTQTSCLLEFSTNSYLSSGGSEGEIENEFSNLLKTKANDNTDCLQNIQVKAESLNVDLVNMHKEGSVDSYELTDSLDSTDSNTRDEVSDGEFLPDIDLTFCIKKNSKNDYLFYGDSPETTDSGFDESDFMSEKLSSLSKREYFCKDMFVPQSGSDSGCNMKVKQSLFFKAISAKPKIEDSRKLKLKSVMNKLLKGTPLPDSLPDVNLPEIIDRSNENVIVSCYLNFGNEK